MDGAAVIARVTHVPWSRRSGAAGVAATRRHACPPRPPAPGPAEARCRAPARVGGVRFDSAACVLDRHRRQRLVTSPLVDATAKAPFARAGSLVLSPAKRL